MVVLITLSFLFCKHAFHCKLNLRTFYCIGFSKPKNCVTIVQLQGRITASVSMQMKVTYTAQPSSCSSLQLIFLFCELTHIHKRPCLYKGLFINDVIIFGGYRHLSLFTPPHVRVTRDKIDFATKQRMSGC